MKKLNAKNRVVILKQINYMKNNLVHSSRSSFRQQSNSRKWVQRLKREEKKRREQIKKEKKELERMRKEIKRKEYEINDILVEEDSDEEGVEPLDVITNVYTVYL